MPRNRFQSILRCLHSNDNDDESTSRLKKIQPLCDMMKQAFKKNQIPGQNMAVDETMILFRERLKFKQYIPGKAHKYGIKV